MSKIGVPNSLTSAQNGVKTLVVGGHYLTIPFNNRMHMTQFFKRDRKKKKK